MLNDNMVIDENDEQSTQDNKIMYFVYFTMYEMILVALISNYHIALVSWILFVIIVTKIQLTSIIKTYG